MPWTYEGKLKTLENKTLRYLGHWNEMKAYRQLGLFRQDTVKFNGLDIAPRDFYHHLLEDHLNQGQVEDVCLMKVIGKGLIDGVEKRVEIQTEEYPDSKLNLSAMEKWTGWHASIVALNILNGTIQAGATAIENALPGSLFLKEAQKRHYSIDIVTF